MRDSTHYLGDGENKVAGIALLLQFPVEIGSQGNISGVELGLDAGPDGREGIEAFGPGPLPVSALQVTGGNIIETGVAQDIVQRFFHRHPEGAQRLEPGSSIP